MFKVLDEICTPTRGSKYSACVDLYAREDCVIGAGETVLVPLGIKINGENSLKGIAALHYAMGLHSHRHSEMLDKFKTRHYLQLEPRSSLRAKGLIVGSGIIDLDYKDEIKMIIHNPLSDIDEIGIRFGVKNRPRIEIKKGDKIAQITLLEHKSYLMNIESNNERNREFDSLIRN